MSANKTNIKRVAVGMSGGIDSTVAAALLQEKGYDVIGITMQIYDGKINIPDKGRSGCFGPGEVRDIEAAAAMAKKLGITHQTLPLANEYTTTVLDYFRREYLSGRTPNPCVLCNQKMKFGAMLVKAKELGIAFDAFATGHYVRLKRDSNGIVHLLRGIDPEKDQSYFLSQLRQEQLQQLIFPLGNMTKTQVREKAAELGFHELIDKPESQDFIECEDYSVLFASTPPNPGPIVDANENVIGEHRGIIHYTIGQRKGLGISGMQEPLFVTRIDSCRNTLVVGTRDELFSSRLTVGKVNWIAGEPPVMPVSVNAKIRQQHKAAPARITPINDQTFCVDFKKPQMAITPGQTVVLYSKNEVIGGGTIQ